MPYSIYRILVFRHYFVQLFTLDFRALFITDHQVTTFNIEQMCLIFYARVLLNRTIIDGNM